MMACGPVGDLTIWNTLEIPIVISTRVTPADFGLDHYPEEEFADVFDRVILAGEQTKVPFTFRVRSSRWDETWLYIGLTTIEGTPYRTARFQATTVRANAPAILIGPNGITVGKID